MCERCGGQQRVIASSELVPGDVAEVAGEEPGMCEQCEGQLRVIASSELVPGDVAEVAGEEPGMCEQCGAPSVGWSVVGCKHPHFSGCRPPHLRCWQQRAGTRTSMHASWA